MRTPKKVVPQVNNNPLGAPKTIYVSVYSSGAFDNSAPTDDLEDVEIGDTYAEYALVKSGTVVSTGKVIE